MRTFNSTSHVLAECPLIEPETGLLWWVDIPEGQVWSRLLAGQGEDRRFDAGSAVGAIAFGQPGCLIVAAEEAVSCLNTQEGIFKELWRPSLPESGRFNDGRVDPWGRLWLGWLTHARQRPGHILRIGPSGPVTIIDDLIAPNGIGFSPDRSLAYVTDSHVNEIRIYSIDQSEAPPVRVGTLAQQVRDRGIFDGLGVDSDGNIWSALFGAGVIVCLRPDGRETHRITLPVRHATSLVFSDDGQIIITTGHRDLSADERTEEPLSGRLLVVPSGVQGLPETRFAFADRFSARSSR
ncbi:MAG: SMP-30/gluconolactonase/LRE family protein [Pseudomonadota bacterium]